MSDVLSDMTQETAESRYLKIVWKKGDFWSRFFLIWQVAGIFIPLIPLTLWALYYFQLEIMTCYVVAWATYPLYLGGSRAAIEKTSVVKEFLSKNMYISSQMYMYTYVEYVDKHGKNGRTPRSIALAFITNSIFYSSILFSVLLGYYFAPFTGFWTFIAITITVIIPSVFIFWFINRSKTQSLYDLAKTRGFHLRELRKTDSVEHIGYHGEK